MKSLPMLVAEDCLPLIVAARDKMEMQLFVCNSPAFRAFTQNHSREDGEVEFLNSIASERAVDVAKLEAEMEGASETRGRSSNNNESIRRAANSCYYRRLRLPKMSYRKGREENAKSSYYQV
jgi:hypothetical protein